MLLLAQGWTASATAEPLERDPDTIGRWTAAFGEGGPAALIFEQTGGSPPDRGRYGLLRGRMMGDLQVGLGLGPGFGQQPDAAPEATLEQQPPEPIDAVADYADGARRTTTRVPVIGSQRFGRCPQAAWCNPAVLGVFPLVP